jgi:hypothetical protein
VRYWKEAGVWSDAAQKHQDMLVKRQGVLAAAWKGLAYKDSMSKEDLKSKWMAARESALKAAGMDLVFQ